MESNSTNKQNIANQHQQQTKQREEKEIQTKSSYNVVIEINNEEKN